MHKPYIEIDDWVRYVNIPIYQKEIDKIRNSVNRQAPLGKKNWAIKTAQKYGLLSTLKDKGRPKKVKSL